MGSINVNLKRLIEKTKLTQSELSRRTGIPQQLINKILQGKTKNPTMGTLQGLAKYFMISVDQLIGDKNLPEEVKTSESEIFFSKIPLLELNHLVQDKLPKETETNHYVLCNITNHGSLFAIKMPNDSLEPKFDRDAIMVFDSTKKPYQGSISIFLEDDIPCIFMTFIKNGVIYVKTINTRYPSFKLRKAADSVICLGTLVQSITNFEETTGQ